MFILRWLKKLYHAMSRDPIEAYLAEAQDLRDLEYRMIQVQRGTASFQRHVGLYSFYRF